MLNVIKPFFQFLLFKNKTKQLYVDLQLSLITNSLFSLRKAAYPRAGVDFN